MNLCACGNAVEDGGASCARCQALQNLGLQPDAGLREIESAYRLLVKVWHPDRFQNDEKLKQAAEEKLKTINSAHAYLTSGPGVNARSRATAGRRGQSEPQPETGTRPAAQARSCAPTRRSMHAIWPKLLFHGDSALTYRLFARTLVFLGACAVFWLFLTAIDAALTSNPATADFYLQLKAGVMRQVEVGSTRMWGIVAGNFRGRRAAIEPAGSGDELPSASPETAEQPARTRGLAKIPHVHGVLPYVTTGLTRAEVIAVLGPPSAWSEEAMTYQGSTFYLRLGRVSGWKLDPQSAPLRVKLWATNPVSPGLAFFTTGSSKDEVIAVQGTPSMLSDNKFGYGGSEVFFENGRVIGWKNDPDSVRLRVPAH